MATSSPPLPDVERIVTDYLLGHGDVAAIVADRVVTQFSDKVTFPAVRLNRVAGSVQVPRRLDGPRLQIESWGRKKSEARNLAAVIQAAMWDLPGNRPHGVVTGVTDVLGPLWSPDPVSDQPRYLHDVVVFAHP